MTKAPEPRSGRAFFGRRKGHRLHAGRQKLVQTLLPGLLIDPKNVPLDARTLFGNDRELFLEIGFGGGENLARRAALNPEAGFIGCEPYIAGIGKLLALIKRDQLDNIRIHDDDAIELLAALRPQSLSGVELLYPDPWPKARHHKRRFISPESLAELARVMRPRTELRFATDIEDYANWTLAHIIRSSDFDWRPDRQGEWTNPWPGYEPTRYEIKARAAGRDPFYFSFHRRSGAMTKA